MSDTETVVRFVVPVNLGEDFDGTSGEAVEEAKEIVSRAIDDVDIHDYSGLTVEVEEV